ncbi:MAG: rhodanese-like domain-containing protein [Pseudonocardia sp.]|nr:rhodanese-like domain-containing protein [Pseudonocardia sp.]
MREHAIAYFAGKLEFETDPSDVRAAQQRGDDFVLLDTRSVAAWRQGRAAGAVHLPTAEIPQRAPGVLDRLTPVVVYCWGPGCNGSTKAALALARLGFAVKEMIGGFEYWAREGLPVETDDGAATRSADPLTAPTTTADCAC